ncbi:hypothetical protein AGMMS50229_05930 [Campylobacterota bacterium]|nr:hypothetical protein AGMMS50229_05930 [Campylobacterota bacterium]
MTLIDNELKDMFHHIETDSNIHSTTNTVIEIDGDICHTTNLGESLKDTRRTMTLIDNVLKDMFHHIETDSNIHSTT